MVNDGIEYGDMQLIREAYHIMKNTLQTRPSMISYSGTGQLPLRGKDSTLMVALTNWEKTEGQATYTDT